MVKRPATPGGYCGTLETASSGDGHAPGLVRTVPGDRVLWSGAASKHQ